MALLQSLHVLLSRPTGHQPFRILCLPSHWTITRPYLPLESVCKQEIRYTYQRDSLLLLRDSLQKNYRLPQATFRNLRDCNVFIKKNRGSRGGVQRNIRPIYEINRRVNSTVEKPRYKNKYRVTGVNSDNLNKITTTSASQKY